MSDEPADERVRLIREVRQRLESLGRAGLDRIPRPKAHVATERPKAAPAPPRPATAPASPPPILATALTLFEEPKIDEPVLPKAERQARLDALAVEVAACTKCPLLSSTRTQTVFGVGDPSARLMFVGEAPGADEDRTGTPFVGRSGMLLTDMITKGMGLKREDVYIANVVKSRPPENRTPLSDEIAHCLPFLERQIAIIRPEFLCLLGKVAASSLLNTAMPMSRLRGRWHRYQGIPTIVTFHPSYLLRTPTAKKDAWEDLQMLMTAMGLQPPDRKKG